MIQLPGCIFDTAMADSVAAPRKHFDFIASHLVFNHRFAFAPQFLPDSLAQTYRTLHPNSTSPHWHHGQKQEQKQAEI
jgi:hypothetical protein